MALMQQWYISRMNSLSGTATIERVLHSVGDTMTYESASRIASLNPDPEVEERLNVLAERSSGGLLTEEERSEYESLVIAGDLIAILQSHAQSMIASSPTTL
jgi:hypothetical protein